MNLLHPYLWIIGGFVVYLVLLVVHRTVRELPFAPYALGLCIATCVELFGFALLFHGF